MHECRDGMDIKERPHKCREHKTTHMDVLVPRKAWMLKAAVQERLVNGE